MSDEQKNKAEELARLEQGAPSASEAALHPNKRGAREQIVREAAKLAGDLCDEGRVVRNMPAAIARSTALTRSDERDELGAAVSAFARERPVDTDAIEGAVRTILEAVGEDPNREGLLDTSRRVAEFYDLIQRSHNS